MILYPFCEDGHQKFLERYQRDERETNPKEADKAERPQT